MNKSLATAAALLITITLAGCSSAAPSPGATSETISPTASAQPTSKPTKTSTPTPTPTPTAAALDLRTDAGLCAADAEMSNLELNDAIAPLLGYPKDRKTRTFEQDEAIRNYKNDAFLRACPQRAG